MIMHLPDTHEERRHLSYPRITALMPVGKYHPNYLRKAVFSLTGQTCPQWRLLIIGDEHNRAALTALLAEELKDPRIEILCARKEQLAHKLNFGMERATTDFVAILLGDDMWSDNAVQVLAGYLDGFPNADLLHSSRAFINENDEIISSVYYARENICSKDFVLESPIKHLLCWRKDKALSIGGLDESIDYVGPDDYDFPWSMAEAQAVFRAVRECLYLLRDHRDCYRLTTHVPRSEQIRETKRILKKHGAPRSKIRRRIRIAKHSYLRQCLYRSRLDRWMKETLGYKAQDGWRDRYR
jgi:hypothetical protein